MRLARLACLLLLVLFSSSASAGVLVKLNRHIESFYSHGVLEPETDLTIEWWFEKDSVRLRSENLLLTHARGSGRVEVVLVNEKQRFELAAPIKADAQVDQDLADRLAKYQAYAKVAAKGRPKSCAQKDCLAFETTDWLLFEKNRFYDRERRLTTTLSAPFDWTLARDLLGVIQEVFLLMPEAKKELAKLQGFVVEETNRRLQQGFSISSSTRLLSITELPEPPASLVPPQEIKPKEKVVFEDLYVVRGLVYY